MRPKGYVDMSQMVGNALYALVLLVVSSACLLFGSIILIDDGGGQPLGGTLMLLIGVGTLVALVVKLMRFKKSDFRTRFEISPKIGEITIVTESAGTLFPLLGLPLNTHCVGFSDEGVFSGERTFFFHFRARGFAKNLAQDFGNGYVWPKSRILDDLSMAFHVGLFAGIWIFMGVALFSTYTIR